MMTGHDVMWKSNQSGVIFSNAHYYVQLETQLLFQNSGMNVGKLLFSTQRGKKLHIMQFIGFISINQPVCVQPGVQMSLSASCHTGARNDLTITNNYRRKSVCECERERELLQTQTAGESRLENRQFTTNYAQPTTPALTHTLYPSFGFLAENLFLQPVPSV